ncbi:MAG: cytochrome c biogenesis protein CcsA [Saprospiraceae bacterium]|nr:cytochrome c biogenesis protein CcsA [Saprospiraceae bacterium]
MHYFTKIFNIIFSTRAAGLYMLLFAAAIGVATFIENDFGTSSAQKLIFKAKWFELLLVLFGFCLIFNVIKFRFFQQKKWGTLMFHLSIIVILMGSGITRYFGYEGIMHIREGESSNTILSSESYLQLQANIKGLQYKTEDKVLFASKGNHNYQQSFLLGQEKVDVELLEFVPNPIEVLTDDPSGAPFIKLVMGGEQGREEFLLKYNSPRLIAGTVFNFAEIPQANAVNIQLKNDSILIAYHEPFMQMVMATQQKDTLAPEKYHMLRFRSLYSSSSFNFVVSEFNKSAKVDVSSSDAKMSSSSIAALKLKLSVNGQSKEFYISGSPGNEGNPRTLSFPEGNFSWSYGAKRIQLPFELKLRDFIMDRYPGTNSASSYASEVTLIDSRKNIQKELRIYMNNILDHDGYRFFQSSFDKDELGTYLSVNRDAPGTWVSYIGYILLTLGLLISLFDKTSRFQYLSRRIQELRPKSLVLLFASLLLNTLLFAQTSTQNVQAQIPAIDPSHAKMFREVIVQDVNGRMKPMNTLSLEILRKLSRKESLYGMNADQVFICMSAFPEIWNKLPIIKIGKHEKIQNLFKNSDGYASYLDFFNAEGEYILRDDVREAFNKKPVDRGVYEKEILKLDEKLNITSMVFSGSLLKLFPVENHPNFQWDAPSGQHIHQQLEIAAEAFPDRFYKAYIEQIREAENTNNWSTANSLIQELKVYQHKLGKDIIPSDSKLTAEILLNDLNVFGKLSKYYGLLALVFLGLLFTSVFAPSKSLKLGLSISLILFIAGFLFQSFGLGLRWYVSGRAPWSNGYESMIYIAWTTVLAGLLFSRKSLGGLAATSLLSSIVLMVAGLSWLDPEITPLVPVLKSYWLTIHVSLEAGSYGFLVLGALIGALNLILMILTTRNNKIRMDRVIDEMSYTSEMTIIGGLVMLSTGTYLGGVWANESWGRYWGWDAKETWALVSILIYSFILHMRLIPGLKSRYAYNTATLFGFASVMMTYYGVNYYLSGLHSYAAGDPVPIPAFVYYLIVILVAISLGAYFRNKQLDISEKT